MRLVTGLVKDSCWGVLSLGTMMVKLMAVLLLTQFVIFLEFSDSIESSDSDDALIML